MHRFIYGISLACLLHCTALYAAPTAEPPPDSEMVYRANLGRAEDIELLIQQGGNPKAVDNNQVGLLFLAAARKDPEGLNVVHSLLSHGLNINAIDPEGKTPLFYAAKGGSRDMVQYLLDSGADPYITDRNGDTARTYGYRAGNTEIVELMDINARKKVDQVNSAYEQINREIQKRYDELAKQQQDSVQTLSKAQQSEVEAERKRMESERNAILKQRELEYKQKAIEQELAQKELTLKQKEELLKKQAELDEQAQKARVDQIKSINTQNRSELEKVQQRNAEDKAALAKQQTAFKEQIMAQIVEIKKQQANAAKLTETQRQALKEQEAQLEERRKKIEAAEKTAIAAAEAAKVKAEQEKQKAEQDKAVKELKKTLETTIEDSNRQKTLESKILEEKRQDEKARQELESTIAEELENEKAAAAEAKAEEEARKEKEKLDAESQKLETTLYDVQMEAHFKAEIAAEAARLKQQEEAEALKNPAIRKARLAAKQKRDEERNAYLGELAYNNCVFQYWYYCYTTNLTTEPSSEALRAYIDGSRKKIIDIQDTLFHDYKMTTDSVRRVSISAKKRVFDQLDVMKSSRERRSRGVGNVEDMEKRCKDISLNWDVIAGSVVTERPKPVNKDDGSGSSTAAPIPQNYNFKK